MSVAQSPKRDLVAEAFVNSDALALNEIYRIKKSWSKYDSKGNGYLNTKKLFHMLSNLNIVVPEEQREVVKKQVDKSNLGLIDFVDFVELYEQGVFKSYVKRRVRFLNFIKNHGLGCILSSKVAL